MLRSIYIYLAPKKHSLVLSFATKYGKLNLISYHEFHGALLYQKICNLVSMYVVEIIIRDFIFSAKAIVGGLLIVYYFKCNMKRGAGAR